MKKQEGFVNNAFVQGVGATVLVLAIVGGYITFVGNNSQKDIKLIQNTGEPKIENVVNVNEITTSAGSTRPVVESGLENPHTFGKLVGALHNNLSKGTDEAIEVLNLGIDDSVYFFGRIGNDVIKYNVEKYKVDEKAKRVWVKARGGDWVEITKGGYNKLVDFLKKHAVEQK